MPYLKKLYLLCKKSEKSIVEWIFLSIFAFVTLGFVKIRVALVKSSLVFVLVESWRLPALIFINMVTLEERLAIASSHFILNMTATCNSIVKLNKTIHTYLP